MKKALIPILVVLIVLGIVYAVKSKPNLGTNTETPIGSPVPETTEPLIANATYLCGGGKKIQAIYYRSHVDLEFSNGNKMSLPQAISASGARYADASETTVFWNKGNTAFVTEKGTTTYENCVEEKAGEVNTTPVPAVVAISLLEDSRCPINARCIQAGTVRVRVRVTAGTKSEESDLTLNQPKMVAGKTVTLTDVTPEPYAGRTLKFEDYKFKFSVK